MKRFIVKQCLFALLVVFLLLVLFFGIPKDKNAYLCEYNKKIELVKNTEQPRLLFVGGSTLAFGIDSKRIADSLGVNVVNLGLHAGIGLRYALEDYAQYMRSGDIVILQPSYSADFKIGGNGSPETMPDLMVATNWRNATAMNQQQLWHIMEGISFYCYRSLVRLVKSPVKGINTPEVNTSYMYVASGFNEYGDEASHWTLPPYENGKTMPKSMAAKKEQQDVHVDSEFIEWFAEIVKMLEAKGCRVYIMPEIATITSFSNSYFPDIQTTLQHHGMDFMVSPQYMPIDDSFMYNGTTHVNREGVTQNSDKIIKMLRKKVGLLLPVG